MVLRISRDGDDRWIFSGLKFSIPGFFWVGKFRRYFFVCAWCDLSRDFFGIQNNLKILGSADCVVRVVSCIPFWKILRHGNSAGDFLWGLIFGPGIFLGFVGSHSECFGF